ncbi:phage integrase SAM-like domain-containing protein [Hymenobacter arcticus]
MPQANRLADGTLETYECRLNMLKRYVETEYAKSLPAADVDVPWCRRYERWLLSPTGGLGGTAMRKHINFLQLTLDYAVAEGWLPTKMLHGYKYQTRIDTPLALSLPAAEVAKLAAALPDLIPSEKQAVTGWLFCCYTGLSWVDYRHFCASPGSYLFTERAGSQGEVATHWLRMVRQKMKRRKPQGFSVPLFDEAAEILLAWRGRLPHTNDVNANKLLHRVEAELELTQSLTTKLARATFSQLKRDEGYSDETVAAMMGHSVAVMNKHYSRVSEHRIALEMSQLSAPPSTGPLAPPSTPPTAAQFPIIVGPGCAIVAQVLPIAPRLAATRRRPPAATQWQRPAAVTSRDGAEAEQGPRVVQMWAATNEDGREVACG